MKKLVILLALVAVMLCVNGQAMAAFEDGHLIRVVYSGTGAGTEYATDLGSFSSLTSPSSSHVILNTNNFSLSSVGASSWSDVNVAYFMVTATSGGFPGNYAWTSGPSAGQTGGGRSMFNAILGGAHTVAGAYQVAGAGAANATLGQIDTSSYWKTMNYGGSGVGQMKGFIPAGNADQNLAALSGAGYVDQKLYYYSTPNSSVAGVGVVSLRTFADGHTEMNAGAPSSVPVPPSVLLLGSGLLGLVGIRRKQAA